MEWKALWLVIGLWLGLARQSDAAMAYLSPARGNLSFDSTMYVSNADYFWAIPPAPIGSTFTIQITRIGIESGPQCAYDSIGVTLSPPNDPNNAKPEEFTRFCGTATLNSGSYSDNLGVSRTAKNVLRTTWSGAIFWFHSDADINGTGFDISYAVSAPMSVVGSKLIADQFIYISINQSFSIPLYPSTYFSNPLSAGAATAADAEVAVSISLLAPNGVTKLPLPAWAFFDTQTVALASPLPHVDPVAGNYTFVLTGTNALNFSAAFTFRVLVLAIGEYDNTSSIVCTPSPPNYDCSITPRQFGDQILTAHPIVPVLASGGGSIAITTPPPSATGLPYQSVIQFTYYVPASGGEASVIDSLHRIDTPTLIPAAIRDSDGTSTLACWPTYVVPGSTIKCDYTPRLAGINVYADPALMPAIDAVTPGVLDTITVPGPGVWTPTGPAFKFSFVATVGIYSATYTLRVMNSPSPVPAVSIYSYIAPNNRTALTCDKYTAVVNQPINCVLRARNNAGPVVTVSDFLRVQSVIAHDFNASVPFVVYTQLPANATVNQTLAFVATPIVLCRNVTFANVTLVRVRNESASALPPPGFNTSLPFNYSYYFINTTYPNYTRSICGPLFDYFTQLQTDFPNDTNARITPLSPFVGTDFTFTLRFVAPGLRFLAIKAGNGTNVYNRTAINVIAGADSTSSLLCPPAIAVGAYATCTIFARINGTATPVLAGSFTPAITVGLRGALTPLIPSRFPPVLTSAGLTASIFEFSFNASDSGAYTVTDGLHSATIYTIGTPDGANSTLVCSATQIVTSALVTCTVKSLSSAGAPVFFYTSRVQPIATFVPSIATPVGTPQPVPGSFGAVTSLSSVDSSSTAPTAVGSSFQFNYTAPLVSGTAYIVVSFVSAVDSSVILSTIKASATLSVTAVPDNTSRIICPSTTLTVNQSMTCFSFGRQMNGGVLTNLASFVYSTAGSSGTITNVRSDVSPPFDVSISDLLNSGLSPADIAADAPSVAGGVNGAIVPPTPISSALPLTAPLAAAASGGIGPNGVPRVVYFDVTCTIPYDTVMISDGVSPPILLSCSPAAVSLSWQTKSNLGYSTLARAIDTPPTAYTPQAMITANRRITQIRCNIQYCAAVTAAREFVMWSGSGLIPLSNSYARAMPWIAVAVLVNSPAAADSNPIYALSKSGVVAHLSGSIWQPFYFSPPNAYAIDLISSTNGGSFMLAASRSQGKVYSWGPASAAAMIGRPVGAGDPLVPSELVFNPPIGAVNLLFAHSYGIIVSDNSVITSWGGALANTILPSESFPSTLTRPPVRGSTGLNLTSIAGGGIRDVAGNEYCVIILTESGLLYGLSLTVQDTSSTFGGDQQSAGSTTGTASQQFELITSLPLDSTGQPMRIQQIALDTYQLIFVDSTNRVWTVSPRADDPKLNVFWQFANGGAAMNASTATVTLSPYAWLQNLFASATVMPTPTPAQPIAAPLAIAASSGLLVTLAAPRVHICPNCGYTDAFASCAAAPYQCATLSYALSIFTFSGTTFYLRRGTVYLDSGFHSSANDLQFISESDSDAFFPHVLSTGNGYNNFNNKFWYPITGAVATASPADGGSIGWPLRTDSDLAAHTATINCQNQPCFGLSGRRYTFQGLTIVNGTAPIGVAGGCVSIAPAFQRLQFWDVHFRACTSTAADGGAVAAGATTQMYVWGSSFVNNRVLGGGASTTGGGAIAQRLAVSSSTSGVGANAESITIVNSYFAVNSVDGFSAASLSGSGTAVGGLGSGDGGAVLAVSSNLRIARSTFTTNSAPGRGGAIQADSPATGFIGQCVVSDNLGGGAGGGISFSRAGTSGWTLSNSIISNNQAILLGGGVYNEDSPLVMAQTQISSNRATLGSSASGGGVYSIGQQLLNMDGCTFTANTARSTGGGLLVSNGHPIVTSTVFQYNSAANGGGVAISSQTIASLSNLTLAHNNATLTGGGLLSEDITSGLLTASTVTGNTSPIGGGVSIKGIGAFTISGHTAFADNSAQSGGAVFWDATLPFIDLDAGGVVFSGNSALHGRDVASQAKFVSYDSSIPISAQSAATSTINATSGSFLGFSFTIRLLDYYNQSLVQDSSTIVSPVGVAPTSVGVSFVGIQAASVVNGVYVWNSAAAPFGIVYRPLSTAAFAIKALLPDGSFILSPTIIVSLLPCLPGQESLDSARCLPCALGRFSNVTTISGPACLDCGIGETTPAVGASACSKCRPGTFNPIVAGTSCSTCGANQYSDVPGRASCDVCWSNSFPRADHSTCDCDALYYLTSPGVCSLCPIGADCRQPGTTVDNVQSLAGYQADVEGTNTRFVACFVQDACLPGGNCTEGYAGNLCTVCPQGRVRASSFGCEDCPKRLYSQLITAAAVLGVLAAFGVITYLTRRAKKGTRPAIFARIVLNSMQLNALAFAFQYNWPDAIQVLVEYELKAVYIGANILSVDCLLGTTFTTPSFYLKTLFFAFIPPLAVMLAMTLYGIIYLVFRKHTLNEDAAQWYKKNVICFSVIVLFVIHPAITKQTLELFTCMDLGSSTSAELYMVGDLSEKCFVGDHLVWMLCLGIPMLCLYVMLIPAALVWEMRRTVNMLVAEQREELRKWYRWVLDGYTDTYCYWEAVCIVRKVIVVLISVQVSFSYEARSLWALFVIVISLATQAYCRPFDKWYLNALETISLSNSFITYFAGHFSFVPELNAAQRNLLTAVVVIVNILFAVAVVLIYEYSVKEGSREWDASSYALKKALKQQQRLMAAQTMIAGGATDLTAAAVTSTAAGEPGADIVAARNREREKAAKKAADKKAAADEAKVAAVAAGLALRPEDGPEITIAGVTVGGGRKSVKGRKSLVPPKVAAAAAANATPTAATSNKKRGSMLDMFGFGSKPAAATDSKDDKPVTVEMSEIDRHIAETEAREAKEAAVKKKAEKLQRKSLSPFLATPKLPGDDDSDDEADPPSLNVAAILTGSAAVAAPASATTPSGAAGTPASALPPDVIIQTPSGPAATVGGQAVDGCLIA